MKKVCAKTIFKLPDEGYVNCHISVCFECQDAKRALIGVAKKFGVTSWIQIHSLQHGLGNKSCGSQMMTTLFKIQSMSICTATGN